MKSKSYHRLLRRQMKKLLPRDLQDRELEPFLEAVNEAYYDFDRDLQQAETTLEQSSKELFQANQNLQKSIESKTEEARELSNRIRSVVNSVQEIVFQTDLSGRWTYLNPAWEKISGYSVKESLGRSFTEFVYPGDRDLSKESLAELVKGDTDSSQYVLRYLSKENEVRWAEATVTLNFDRAGRLTGSSGTLNDITERYKAQERIRETNLNLAEAQKIANLGSWEYAAQDLQNGYWTDQVFHILGFQNKAHGEMPLFSLFSRASGEDRDRAEAAINRALKFGEPEEVRYRVQVGENTKWVLLKAEPIVAEAGNVIKLVGTILDITKQKAVEKQLTEAKRLAEDALAAKSDFLSNMSHEIRTPMNAIMGLTDLMIKEGQLSGNILENLKLINYSAENLLVIINDILDYSKIEANKIKFEKIEFNVGQLVDKLIKTFGIKAREKNLTLNAVVDPDIPKTILGDPYRLNQILVNLLSNALKFTHQGKVEVLVRLQKLKPRRVKLHFSVNDTGIGISNKKQKDIFESFTQANSDITRNFGGTGLGLTITKRLIESQGGTIKLKSKEGEGTRFFFELEFDLAGEPRAVPEADPNEASPHIELKGRQILVAEDNQVNQILLQQICKKWQVKLNVVENGKQAFEASQKQPFDLILMDLQMPVMSGYEATTKIRNSALSENRHTPIIALTADVFEETRNRVQNSGFNDYISKPYKEQALREKIEQNLSKPVKQS